MDARMKDFDALVCHPDPVVLKLNKLQNQLTEKEMELGQAQSEIKALRTTEVLKNKAVVELGNEVDILEEKLRANDNQLEQKNLYIKKLTDEKREALTAQYAAEATLRRVYSDQKDDDYVPIELIIAPLEAELKMRKSEVAALQEDKRALERHMKSKESALLEAERILKSALERALIVEEIQNQNFELRRQNEICQEENKILDKSFRQKVLEVEKLTQTINELEEDILKGGAVANMIRDYRRQISELNEEKRTLERELSRIKVSASRIAIVMANEWKDDKDKVMPVKQWLDERRVFQAEIQKLKDKLTLSEKTAKAEAQVKEKLKLRLKTIEEGLKRASGFSVDVNGDPKNEKSNSFFGILSSNTKTKKRSMSQPVTSVITKSAMQMLDEEKNSSAPYNLQQKNPSGESRVKRSLWAARSKVIDSNGKENNEMDKHDMVDHEKCNDETTETGKVMDIIGSKKEMESDDMVSGYLYDRLQKEVINLRKFYELKESTLNVKDDEIKVLVKKVETLTRAMEVESKKIKRETLMRDKDLASVKVDNKRKNANSSKWLVMFCNSLCLQSVEFFLHLLLVKDKSSVKN